MISGVGYLIEPLKKICSKKWEMPLSFGVSYLEPTPTANSVVTESKCGIGMVISVRPFLRVVFSNIGPFYLKQFCSSTGDHRQYPKLQTPSLRSDPEAYLI